jgi:hypothetical protein
MTVEFKTTISIVDEKAFRDTARDNGHAIADGLLSPDLVYTAVIAPQSDEDQSTDGYRISGYEVATRDNKEFDITLAVDVLDHDRFVEASRSAYEACYFDNNWHPSSLAEAALEKLVLGNSNVSPYDAGYSVNSWEFTKDVPVEARATIPTPR